MPDQPQGVGPFHLRMEQTNPTPEVSTPSPEDRLLAMYSEEDKREADDVGEPEEVEAEEVQQDQPEAEAESVETTEAEPEPSDGEEVEFDGASFKLPPKIAEVVKKAESLQADYTRKTQDVADQRKAVEDRSQYLQAREMVLQTAFSEAAQVQSLQSQLQQFDSLDWNALFAEDSNRAIQLNFARQQLQTQLGQAQGKLNEKIAQAQQIQSQHLQKQQELGKAELQRRIGKASEQELQATWKQGLDLGYSEAELKDSTDARLMHALFKAAKFDQLSQAQKSAVTKKVAQAKPMPAGTARTPVTGPLAKIDEAKSRLKKSGKDSDALAALTQMFERKRVR